MTTKSLEIQRCRGNFGIRYFCHRSKRHCCHLLMVHRWCCTEEPGKLKRGICEREECKNKHSACLRCYLYFFCFVFFILWLCILHGQNTGILILSSTDLYAYPYNFKIYYQNCFGPFSSTFGGTYCTYTCSLQLREKTGTSLLSALTFSMCPRSSSPQKFSVLLGLKDNALYLDVCSQNPLGKGEKAGSSAKEGRQCELWLLVSALCMTKRRVRSLGFLQGHTSRGLWTLIFY